MGDIGRLFLELMMGYVVLMVFLIVVVVWVVCYFGAVSVV